MNLPDVQSQLDDRGIGLDEVGICGLRYPVSVFDSEHGNQKTVALISLSVGLDHSQKGSHLSRFIEILDAHAGELTPQSIPQVLQELQRRLDVRRARLQMEFPYFIRRHAPVSGANALVDYACTVTADIREQDVRISLSVRVPVTSVCPCSKAISDYGAHNQRGTLTIHAIPAKPGDVESAPLWLEELIEAAEQSASSPVFPLLKRVDERHVTMAGFDNPVFVEDMVRGTTEILRRDQRIARFCVEAINEESIHNHNAFARITWPPSDEELEW